MNYTDHNHPFRFQLIEELPKSPSPFPTAAVAFYTKKIIWINIDHKVGNF